MTDRELRDLIKASRDLAAIAGGVARFASGTGFAHAFVLLFHHETHDTVLHLDGVDPPHATLPANANLRFALKDEDVAAFHASIVAVASTNENALESSPFLTAKLGLIRAIAIPLRDADGELGVLLAGHAATENEWPADAPTKLLAITPEVTTALRHVFLRDRYRLEHATRLQQQTENEHLLRELRKRNEEMLDDLEQAREFQARMLPRPPAIEGIRVEMVYRPHDAVSGDFHDVSFENGRLRVFVADTTGHGVRAGLATMLLKAEYEALKRVAANPADLLTRLNTRIAEAYRSSTLTLTAICYDLDVKTGALRFATAAHPSAVIVHGDTARELPSGGSFIGVVPELILVEGTADLANGDAIYIYTDGISEASGVSGELFGEDRVFAALLEGHKDGNGARTLVKAAEVFARPRGFNDDVAIVGVCRTS